MVPLARHPHRSRRGRVGAIAAGALSGAAAVGWSGTSGAAITAVSPSGATVGPGQGATATVTFRPEGVQPSCLTADAPPGTSASLSGGCATNPDQHTNRLSVGTTAGTAPGTYSIRILERDRTGTVTGSATFTLTVRGPDPSTTRPATTARPTTTSRPTTAPPPTTEAPTTTEVPTSTEAPPTTTAAPTPPSLAQVAEQPLPDEVLFVPLPGRLRQGCVPLEQPCVDPDFELTIVPAAGRQLVWVADGASPSPPRSDVIISPVGADPSTVASAAFLVPALDARPAGGRLQLVPAAALRGGFRLGPAEGLPDGVALAPTIRPPVAPPDPPLLASTLFEAPARMATAELSGARPAVLVYGPRAHVVAGLLADPAWRLGGTWVPLFSERGMAHLALGPDGRVGLAVPSSLGAETLAPVRIVEQDSGDGWAVVGLLLAGGAVLLGGAGVVRRVRRR